MYKRMKTLSILVSPRSCLPWSGDGYRWRLRPCPKLGEHHRRPGVAAQPQDPQAPEVDLSKANLMRSSRAVVIGSLSMMLAD